MVGKDPNEFSTIKEYTFSSHRGIGFLFGIGKKLDLSKVMFVMNLRVALRPENSFVLPVLFTTKVTLLLSASQPCPIVKYIFVFQIQYCTPKLHNQPKTTQHIRVHMGFLAYTLNSALLPSQQISLSIFSIAGKVLCPCDPCHKIQ